MIADANLVNFLIAKQREEGSCPVSDTQFLKPLLQFDIILFEIQTASSEHDLKVIVQASEKMKSTYADLKKALDSSVKQIHTYIAKKTKEKEALAVKVVKEEAKRQQKLEKEAKKQEEKDALRGKSFNSSAATGSGSGGGGGNALQCRFGASNFFPLV